MKWDFRHHLLTQTEVAKRANVSILWIQRLETNQLHTNYTIRRPDQVARALGVELYDLYKRADEMMGPHLGWKRKACKMMNKRRRAVLVMEEATGKRIRRLSLAEPYPKSHEIYLTIEFDDETEILIEVECRPWFGITYLARDSHGELEPIEESIHGSIRSLAERRR